VLIGKSTISMAIFNSYVSLPEGNHCVTSKNFQAPSSFLAQWSGNLEHWFTIEVAQNSTFTGKNWSHLVMTSTSPWKIPFKINGGLANAGKIIDFYLWAMVHGWWFYWRSNCGVYPLVIWLLQFAMVKPKLPIDRNRWFSQRLLNLPFICRGFSMANC